MTVIKTNYFADRMRVKLLSGITIEPDEIEYLIELAEEPEPSPEDYFGCDDGDCRCDCKHCQKCEETS